MPRRPALLARPLQAFALLVAVLIAGGAFAQEKSWFTALKIESTFLQSDLAGTWAVHQLSIVEDAATWAFGELSIDPDGTISDGSTTDAVGRMRTFRSGRLTVSPAGRIDGDFTVSEGGLDLEFLLREGQLQGKTGAPAVKDVAALAVSCSTCSPAETAILLLTRRQGAFATADLNGAWRIYNLRFENDTNELTWEFGPVNLQEDGRLNPDDLLDNFLRDPAGVERTIIAASLTVDADGAVQGFLESRNGGLRVDDVIDGVLDPDKNRLTAVLETDASERILTLWFKTDRSVVFSTAQDLVGSWRLFGVGFESPPGDVFTAFGNLEIETPPGTGPDATVTGDSLTAVGTESVRIVGDRTALNSVGRLDGTVESNEDRIVIRSDPALAVRQDGRMDLRKTSLAFTADGFITGAPADPDEPDDGLGESCFITVAGRSD